MIPEYKICYSCNPNKISKRADKVGSYHPLDNFHKSSKSKIGVGYQCKACKRRVQKKHEANKRVYREAEKKRLLSFRSRKMRLIDKAWVRPTNITTHENWGTI